MAQQRSRKQLRGFTLVEILIVVVILGILAAIVVPQFTNAAEEARGGNLASQIRSIENQLELFRARNGAYPDIVAAGWGNPTTPGTMIGDGYLKSAPTNPFNQAQGVIAGTAGAATAGWHFDAATGAFGASYFDEANGVPTPTTP
ncbi:MAG: prepilin-type N-terminal cleavage/methylation domain-containing protein [Planctomycetota bacterium]